jgi:hypothetical protein
MRGKSIRRIFRAHQQIAVASGLQGTDVTTCIWKKLFPAEKRPCEPHELECLWRNAAGLEISGQKGNTSVGELAGSLNTGKSSLLTSEEGQFRAIIIDCIQSLARAELTIRRRLP